MVKHWKCSRKCQEQDRDASLQGYFAIIGPRQRIKPEKKKRGINTGGKVRKMSLFTTIQLFI